MGEEFRKYEGRPLLILQNLKIQNFIFQKKSKVRVRVRIESQIGLGLWSTPGRVKVRIRSEEGLGSNPR